jgi:hypothetical protein
MNQHRVINKYLKCYLIGPMEKVKAQDSGRGWRDKIRPELESLIDADNNPVYVFDPTKEEQNKVGMETKLFHKKILGWITAGNNDKVAEGTTLIWHGKSYLAKNEETQEEQLIHIMGDVDYVLNSNFLIMRMEEGDQPCGTYMEAGMALEHHIPIYVIQTMPRDKYPVSFVGAVFATGGRFFDNPTQLLEFLQNIYKLRVKK